MAFKQFIGVQNVLKAKTTHNSLMKKQQIREETVYLAAFSYHGFLVSSNTALFSTSSSCHLFTGYKGYTGEESAAVPSVKNKMILTKHQREREVILQWYKPIHCERSDIIPKDEPMTPKL